MLSCQLCVTPWTVAHRAPPRDSPVRNTRVGCHALLQWVFPTQESNPRLLSLLICRQILYHLSHQGSPESWNGLPFPPLRDLPDPGIKPSSLRPPALAGRFFTTRPAGELPCICPLFCLIWGICIFLLLFTLWLR